MTFQTNQYGKVNTKTPREVVLINSVGGCSWRRCAFCEYCNTYSNTAIEAARLNRQTLSLVTGEYGVLQVVNSASFSENPIATWFDILEVCREHGIHTLIVESHWIFRDQNQRIRDFFKGIEVQIIYGVETFNFHRREVEWFKGYGNITAEQLAQYADSVNLLIGVRGQTMADIEEDFRLATRHFKRVNVCVFEPNDTDIERDNELMDQFYTSVLFEQYKNNPQVEILDGLDRRAPDNLGFVGVGAQYN